MSYETFSDEIWKNIPVYSLIASKWKTTGKQRNKEEKKKKEEKSKEKRERGYRYIGRTLVSRWRMSSYAHALNP